MLTHFISPGQCARCRLCCNFQRSFAWETPALTPDLVQIMRQRNVVLRQRADGSTTFSLCFPDDAPEDYCAICPVLDPSSGCILSREQRPLECRLWPLRLMRSPSGQLCVALYSACPALTPATREQITAYAAGGLRHTLLRLANEQPLSIRSFNSAYTVLFYLD